jgi:hypothetical protein
MNFKLKKLYNGILMPSIGLGVYKTKDGNEVKKTIKTALETGYRMIDTASIYNNEIGVGEAIRECNISREDIFITTKLWNNDQGYEKTIEAFHSSLKKLNLEYIDLYLVHWPVYGSYVETYHALIALMNTDLHFREPLMSIKNIFNSTSPVVMSHLSNLDSNRFYSTKDPLMGLFNDRFLLDNKVAAFKSLPTHTQTVLQIFAYGN